MAVRVNRATPADAPIFMSMIRELAEFEKMPEAVKVMAVRVNRATPADAPIFMSMIRELAEFEKMPEAVKVPFSEHYTALAFTFRLQWNVLDWNSNAIAFYETLPCENLTKKEGWLLYRLDAEGIAALAQPKITTPRQEQKLQNGSE
ncbi:hypothetical protein OSTOST_03528 [Ostertagia ostertagi]